MKKCFPGKVYLFVGRTDPQKLSAKNGRAQNKRGSRHKRRKPGTNLLKRARRDEIIVWEIEIKKEIIGNFAAMKERVEEFWRKLRLRRHERRRSLGVFIDPHFAGSGYHGYFTMSLAMLLPAFTR